MCRKTVVLIGSPVMANVGGADTAMLVSKSQGFPKIYGMPKYRTKDGCFHVTWAVAAAVVMAQILGCWEASGVPGWF